MYKKLMLLLSLLLVAVLLLTGCDSAATEAPVEKEPEAVAEEVEEVEEAEEAEEAEPSIEDTIYVGYGTEHVTLHPLINNTADTNQVLYNVYALLWRVSPDGALENDLLEDWSVSDDMLAWTLTLKKDLKFSNGSDLTTQDVYDTFTTAINNPESNMGEEIAFISSIEIVDDLTMIFQTEEPYPALRNILAANVGVVMSSEDLEKPYEEINIHPESYGYSGPYKITKWEQNKELVLERNEFYYGEPAVTDRIVLYPITEPSARGAALETGEIDIATLLQSEQLELIKSKPDELKIHIAAGPFSRVFRFACNDPIIGDQNVRLAIMWAIDYEAINEALFPGLYQPSISGLIRGALGHEDLGEHYQDLDKAKEYLAAAGYPDGFETEIHTTARYPKGVELGEAVAGNLALVGIDAEVVVWEWAAFLEELAPKTAETLDMPMFIYGAGADTLDGDTGFNRLYTCSTDGTNFLNRGLCCNPEVDELVFAAEVSTDQDFRRDAYARVSQILFWENPMQIFINDPAYGYGLDVNLQDFWTDPVNKMHLEEAYILVKE